MVYSIFLSAGQCQLILDLIKNNKGAVLCHQGEHQATDLEHMNLDYDLLVGMFENLEKAESESPGCVCVHGFCL